MSNNYNDIEQAIEEDTFEEAAAQKMPVGTEEESFAANDKAEDATKKAPKRKGDKDAKDEPSPKVGSVKKEDVESYDFADDLSALVESEATLSDEFKAKSAIIFETAINSKISEKIEELEEDYQERLETELNETREDMIDKVDSYLNYVVENWMTENELAIEQGLRTEIAEDFMGSLKDLFVESYIEVPESKVDLVDSLAEQVEELEDTLNTRTAEVIEMTEALERHERNEIIREHSYGLADTEIEKLNSLVESLDFEDAETFASKVKTVKESYFKKEVVGDQEEIIEDYSADETVETNGIMGSYLSAIKKTNK